MNGRLNEKKKLMVHVYDRDMEQTVSKEEGQCYIMAAKYVNKKNNAYSDYYYLHKSFLRTWIFIGFLLAYPKKSVSLRLNKSTAS